MHSRKRWRMPVNDFALARGATEPVTVKHTAETVWEPRFLAEIVAGRDRSVLVVLGCFVLAAPAQAEVLQFQCSWNDARPINIRVDTTTKEATRDDGGTTYTVMKVTRFGVWLMIDEPGNVSGLKLQMIQRPEAIKPANAPVDWSKAGKWVDIVTSTTGMVSPIDGGKCWESPSSK